MAFNTFLPGLILSVVVINAAFAATLSEQIDDLRAHYLMLENAKTDFQSAQSRGELDATEQSDYLAWIRQMNEQFVQQCNMLTKTNQAALPGDLPADLPCDQALASGLTHAAIDLASEHTEAEQTGTLIDELNATLGDFDERLLQEQARVKAQVPRTESSSGDSGGGDSGNGGSGEGTPGAQDDGEAGQDSDIAAGGEQGDADESQATRGQASGDKKSSSSESGAPGKAMPGRKSDVPDNIPDGSDDDVVARQLREAAEKETDPELKKKLWEEYRRYKEGTS